MRWSVRSEGAQPGLGGQDPPDLRRGPRHVLPLQRRPPSPPRCPRSRGKTCGAGTSASNPPWRQATTHRSMVVRETLTPAGRTAPHAPARPAAHHLAPLPRGQGSIHRPLGQRPPPQRDRLRPPPAGGGLPPLLSSSTSWECRVCPGIPPPWPVAAVTKAKSVRGIQGRVEPHGRTAGASHRPPVRCAATSWAVTAASAGNRRASPAATASSTARHSRPAKPAGTNGRVSGSASGSTPVSASRTQRPARRTATATTTPSTPAPATGPRPATPATAAAAARPAAAAVSRQHQRRHDHRRAVPAPRPQIRRQQHMRPAAAPAPGPPRAKLRQAVEHRHHPPPPHPHRASTPPQHGPRSRPAASRASTLSAEPRTVITVVPPPAPTRRPSPSPCEKDHGEGRCHHLHRHGDAVHHPPHPQPANDIKTTPSTSHTPAPMDNPKGGDQGGA